MKREAPDAIESGKRNRFTGLILSLGAKLGSRDCQRSSDDSPKYNSSASLEMVLKIGLSRRLRVCSGFSFGGSLAEIFVLP